jgi:hypothetical protein
MSARFGLRHFLPPLVCLQADYPLRPRVKRHRERTNSAKRSGNARPVRSRAAEGESQHNHSIVDMDTRVVNVLPSR